MIARFPVSSALSLAFQSAASNSASKLAKTVHQASRCGIGKQSVSSWNAHLTRRTAERLMADGILPRS